MTTFRNIKKIPAKLLYDILKSTFPQFLKEGIKYKKALSYGLTEDSTSIQDVHGTELYHVTVTPEEITIHKLIDKNKAMDEQLEKFIHACLLQ
ncbi:hypothetical protein [Pedobacter sp. L105]|uniref:hypothetical protein n=1 Tax=Pedobacter sp. L105 TaxID=1641871 RepID=UPI00131C1582|nr:hypothetical protein [Pedobacter sp. L105]